MTPSGLYTHSPVVDKVSPRSKILALGQLKIWRKTLTTNDEIHDSRNYASFESMARLSQIPTPDNEGATLS
jgi:hypothetical protein